MTNSSITRQIKVNEQVLGEKGFSRNEAKR